MSRIKQYRQRHRIKQIDLAAMLGWSQQKMCRAETSPSVEANIRKFVGIARDIELATNGAISIASWLDDPGDQDCAGNAGDHPDKHKAA